MEKENSTTPNPEIKIKVPPHRSVAGALAAMKIAEDLANGREIIIPSLGLTLNLETTS